MSFIKKINFRFLANLQIKILLLGLITIYSVQTSYADPILANIIEKIKPSIVAIGTFMPKRNPRAVFLGTGFAAGKGNIVVTNAHVIPSKLDYEHLEQIAVFYRKGKEEKAILAKVVALDNEHDLVVLKLEQGQLPPVKLGNVSEVREGQLFAFTGYPIGMVLGLYPVTHRGIVSAISPNIIPMLRSQQLNMKLFRRLQNPYDVFQLDATAYPGNSGSPLYDIATGNVIGVINKVFVQESKENLLSNPSGISYAIPINHLDKLLKDKGLQ
ncbi:Serine protease [Candidatus Methylobacter favarea]|uniref:Serine protease n=1 Tax=Candidatus Methylobacter favarea TaxID=2707345 RepID=A0A8S0XU50_9GAMM|nr:serine protease [Candidatus Methylobacter favarea]CAA9892288.1 Serine protease [Candidatus Methylobacter favarea]